MIVTFKSKAASDVIMFGDNAYALMKIMGKGPEPKGILTVEQLPEAIAALQAAITQEKDVRNNDDDDGKPAIERNVSVAQRAQPLLEVLERSLKKNTPVVWGV